MILDHLDRANRYAERSGRLFTAFEYLSKTDLAGLPPGRIDLDGERMYALVQEYVTKLPEEGKWEAHRRYVDVQYILSGHERIGYAPSEYLQSGTYVEEKDFLPLRGEGVSLELSAGFFVVFFPEDAHMPGLAAGKPGPVKKVVVKVAV
jgi:YhcH/YjgK/YiaL family protein